MAGSDTPRKHTRAVRSAVAVGLGVATAVWTFSLTPWYGRAEGPMLDARFRLRPPIAIAPNIATIDIDSQALAQQKAWPWPRDRHTRLLGLTTALGVDAIAFDIFFPEPSPAASITRDDFFALQGQVRAEDFPDYDRDFIRALAAAGNVYLAQLFAFHEDSAVLDNPQKLRQAEARLAESVRRGRALAVDAAIAAEFPRVEAPDAIPLPTFAGAAHGVGAVQVREDPDGVVRHFPLFVRYDIELTGGEGRVPCLFPSLPLVMACHAVGVQLDELILAADRTVTIPNPAGDPIVVPLNEDGMVLVNWAGDWKDTFTHVSYGVFDAIEEQLEIARIKHALAEAGTQGWSAGPQAVVTVLREFARTQGELQNLFQTLWGAYNYHALLEEEPRIDAQQAVTRFLGPMAEREELVAAQQDIFYNVAAHHAALAGAPQPSGVPDALWGRARVVAQAIRDAGGPQPGDAPYYFRGKPVYTENRLIFAGTVAPALKGAMCFYGLTAAGTHDMRPTPVNSVYPMLGVHPNLYNSIVTNQVLREMPRAWRLPLFVAFALCVSLYAVEKGAARVAMTTVLLVAVYVVTSYLLFARAGWVLEVVGPVMAVVGTAGAVAYQNYRREERERQYIRGAFEQYMNPNVVAQIASNPEQLQLGGQELDATAFFSDVAGFTTISESLSSQELVALLNEYLTAMTELVFKYDGLLDKYEGDAIIAIFGAPVQSHDHATRACHASLDMQRKLVEMRTKWNAEGRHELTARIGLSSGPMTVGNMGSTMRFDYTMMGDTVNLASRLEGANKQYGTHLMCSDATLERCDGSVQARELDLLRVKGKKEPVRVYEVYAKQGETVADDFARALQHYLAGLQLYREWQFEEAVVAFEKALAILPDDGPSKTYLQRCKICIMNPPPADWDGVFTMTTK